MRTDIENFFLTHKLIVQDKIQCVESGKSVPDDDVSRKTERKLPKSNFHTFIKAIC